MTPTDYYACVLDQLREAFRGSDCVVANGEGLDTEGLDPAFPSVVEPVDALEDLTVRRALQVHLPVIGRLGASVLMPLDIEIFLEGENHLLYEDRIAHRRWFERVVPVVHFVRDFLEQRGIPHLLDYTPSGAHLLWRLPCDSAAGRAVASIGFLEEDLVRACRYVDPDDLRRRNGVSLDAARIFSGLGKLAEYIFLATFDEFGDAADSGRLPVSLSDSQARCINFDLSWAEGSPFMRCIRSPLSLHAKNREKHGMWHQPPLCAVPGSMFDGQRRHHSAGIAKVTACMWDLQAAAERARRFSGRIPEADSSLVGLVEEYRASWLGRFHAAFEGTQELPRGEALRRARIDRNVGERVQAVLAQPNPLALQPRRMKALTADLVLEAGWQPRHVANLLRDLYIDPAHAWSVDFLRYPAEEKANFWARAFSAFILRGVRRGSR